MRGRRIERHFVAALAVMCFAPVTSTGALAADPVVEQRLSDLVRQTILDNLPREFTGDNDWGQKREVLSGLKFKTDDGRLRISKRTKEVNDGVWTNYRVMLIDPAQQFRLRVANLRRVAPGRLAVQVFLSAQLAGEARYERWRRGVKMLNFKVEAQSTFEAALNCEIGLRFVSGRFLRELAVDPKVTSVRLSLVDINLDRVSRIDGPVAQELGDRLTHALDRELRGRQDEVARKLNEAVHSHPEKLRFSADNFISQGWTAARQLLLTLAQSPAPPASR